MKNLAWRHVYSLRALVFCLLHCKLRTGKCFTMGTAVYNEYRFFNAWISIRVYISGLNAWESSLTNTLYYLWVHFLKVSLKDRKWDSEAKRIKRLGARKLWLFSPIWSWLNWHFFEFLTYPLLSLHWQENHFYRKTLKYWFFLCIVIRL